MTPYDLPRITLRPSADLMRVLSAYAKLHNVSLDVYVLNLVLDGIEAENHAKMNLAELPEIGARGGPRHQRPAVVQAGPTGGNESPHRLFTAKGLSQRLGISTGLIYQIKTHNAHLAESGSEQLIFNGRYSTVQKLSDWLDRHPEAFAKGERRPKPNLSEEEMIADSYRHYSEHMAEEARPLIGAPSPIARPDIMQAGLRVFLETPENVAGERNVRWRRAHQVCQLDEQMVHDAFIAAELSKDAPKTNRGWTTPNRIRRWLIAHPEFVARYTRPS